MSMLIALVLMRRILCIMPQNKALKRLLTLFFLMEVHLIGCSVTAVTPTVPVNPLVTTSREPPTATTDPSSEDIELVMAMNASIQSAISEGFPQTGNNIPATTVAVVTPTVPVNPRVTILTEPPTATTDPYSDEDIELAMAMNASIQSAISEGFPLTGNNIPATPVAAVTSAVPVNPRVTASREPPTATIDPSSEDIELAMALNASIHSAISEGFPLADNNIPATPVAAVTPTVSVNPRVTTSREPPTATTDPSSEDIELAMAMNASIQSAISEGFPLTGNNIPATPVAAVTPTIPVNPQVTILTEPPTATTDPSSDEDIELAMAMSASIQSAISEGALPLSVDIQSTIALPPPTSPISSTPPINTDIFYISNSSAISFTVNTNPGTSSTNNSSNAILNSCVVCMDAAREGLCIPCGHMVGCMSCLNEIHARQLRCPLCRTPIKQIMKVYNV